MIRFALLLTVSLGALLLTGCGRDATDSGAGENFPVWISDPFHDGQFGAVGTARPSAIGPQLSMKQAQNDGREGLATTIQTTVQSVFTRYMSEGGEIFSDEDRTQIDGMAVEMTRSIARQITDQVLSGSRQKELWIDEEGFFGKKGQYFVWMVIEREQMGLVQEQMNAGIRDNLADRFAYARADLQAQEAVADLDRLVGEQLANQQNAVTGVAAPAQ